MYNDYIEVIAHDKVLFPFWVISRELSNEYLDAFHETVHLIAKRYGFMV